MLYVIATPIGNLKDISLRAIETLKSCDFIIAENPKYSRRLLQYIDSLSDIIPNKVVQSGDQTVGKNSGGASVEDKEICQFAEHNEQRVLKDLTSRLVTENGALITDAGTPGISDPGFRLVRECVKNNIQVVPIPGPNAAIAALSASGLPTDRFLFLGFLQKTEAKTIAALQTAADAEATAIFYESPERVCKTLSYIANAFPTAQIVIARELTKIHEEFLRGTPSAVLNQLKTRAAIKGEFTVVVSLKKVDKF